MACCGMVMGRVRVGWACEYESVTWLRVNCSIRRGNNFVSVFPKSYIQCSLELLSHQGAVHSKPETFPVAPTGSSFIFHNCQA